MSPLQSGIAGYVQPVQLLPEGASVAEAWKALQRSRHGTVYVVDGGGVLQGALNFREFDWMAGNGAARSAGDLVAAGTTVCIREAARLWQLLKLLNGDNASGQRLEEIPVVDAANRIRGAIDRNELRKALDGVWLEA